jgi:ribosomal protein S18 acetylase RimI-like enzyme
MAMNRLLKRNVKQVWTTVDSKDEVAIRLFTKRGFTEAARTVVMKNDSAQV